jgi:ABC-2 type transport system ATP-binding protein
MIEARELTKDYGTVVAVSDVSFDVGAGEIVGFLGPNGAGKTTTLRILAGFLGATSGSARVFGFDIAKESQRAREKLGYMPEAAPLYPELRVREYLGFRAALKRVPWRERKAAVGRALERAAIVDVADTLIGHLSKGYRQRVALADALVSSPPLLILDEPTAGLDPNQIVEVRRLIRELREKHTILLSTHILSEVEAVCDRAIVIARGKVAGQGTLAELTARRSGSEVVISARGQREKLEAALGALTGVERVLIEAESGEDLFRIRCVGGKEREREPLAEEAVKRLVEAGAGVRRVEAVKASLEEVFAELTKEAGTPGAEEKTADTASTTAPEADPAASDEVKP